MALQPRNCDRARAWVSLRLDGEISEIEEALLEAHLRTCPTCREFDDDVRGMVLTLRAQPLERVEHPVTVAGRRRLRVRTGAVASVAAVVAAVVGVTAVISTQAEKGPASHTPAKAPVVAPDDQDLAQLRALRVLQLGGRPQRGSGVGAFGPVTTRQLRPPG
jgi:predicted anti-sigma-YlaC factor YlaD